MVEEITKEVKNSKRRKKIIIAILLICIPVMFFLGYQLWRAGLVVSPNQINNTEIELNGDILNSKSEIMITLELGRFKKYSGYWIETNEAKNTLEVQLYQNYSLSDSQEETLTIPLDILESEELQQGINRITISGFTFFNTEELYTEYWLIKYKKLPMSFINWADIGSLYYFALISPETDPAPLIG